MAAGLCARGATFMAAVHAIGCAAGNARKGPQDNPAIGVGPNRKTRVVVPFLAAFLAFFRAWMVPVARETLGAGASFYVPCAWRRFAIALRACRPSELWPCNI